jgi:hypothetical protein
LTVSLPGKSIAAATTTSGLSATRKTWSPNPNAPANWIADVEKWRQDLGVTKENLSYEMGFWNVEGSSAYAVIAGTLTVMIKDQSIVRTGTLAYTFAKRDGVWKIEAQAWGRTS